MLKSAVRSSMLSLIVLSFFWGVSSAVALTNVSLIGANKFFEHVNNSNLAGFTITIQAPHPALSLNVAVENITTSNADFLAIKDSTGAIISSPLSVNASNSTIPTRIVIYVAMNHDNLNQGDGGEFEESARLKVSSTQITNGEVAQVFGIRGSGDANVDGMFDPSDLIAVYQAGKYETADKASWYEGDWNYDGYFTSADLVAAYQAGWYAGGQAAMIAYAEQLFN